MPAVLLETVAIIASIVFCFLFKVCAISSSLCSRAAPSPSATMDSAAVAQMWPCALSPLRAVAFHPTPRTVCADAALSPLPWLHTLHTLQGLDWDQMFAAVFRPPFKPSLALGSLDTTHFADYSRLPHVVGEVVSERWICWAAVCRFQARAW